MLHGCKRGPWCDDAALLLVMLPASYCYTSCSCLLQPHILQLLHRRTGHRGLAMVAQSARTPNTALPLQSMAPAQLQQQVPHKERLLPAGSCCCLLRLTCCGQDPLQSSGQA
eukprot:GHRQ01024999.1.p2 GENE.GHRQ01024999.1~~GHRQ01024999.1.p2  ORF type:complete len:112 (+),score=9.00 GHRQ01024999.1:598-933(+)